MKILSFEMIEEFVRKGHTLLNFTSCGKNYVSIHLSYESQSKKHFKGKPIKGRICNIESFQILYKIYKVAGPIRLKYSSSKGYIWENYFLFITGLDSIIGSNLNQEFFEKAAQRYKDQREILNKALSE